MTTNEYNKLKAEIIKSYGKPVYELNKAVNDSAVKLTELKQLYLKDKEEVRRTKELIEDVKKLNIPSVDRVCIPEVLLKDSWLTPFNADQKAVIAQWMLNTEQTMPELAEATGLDMSVIRSTLRSEAFNLLRSNLTLAWKNMLPLRAIAAVNAVLGSTTDNTKLLAAKLILIDAQILRSDQVDVTVNKPKEVLLDEATQEKLRKLGNKVLGIGDNSND